MRPSWDASREAVQTEMNRAMDTFLAGGGEIKTYGPECYRHEGLKLSKRELAAAYSNQTAIQRHINREKNEKEDKI